MVGVHRPRRVLGYQMVIDCLGCQEEICCDIDHGYEFLDQVYEVLNVGKQAQPYIFKTCEKAAPGQPGYSGWIPLVESGVQIRTSAAQGQISIDIHVDREVNRQRVETFVREWFRPGHLEVGWIERYTEVALAAVA